MFNDIHVRDFNFKKSLISNSKFRENKNQGIELKWLINFSQRRMILVKPSLNSDWNNGQTLNYIFLVDAPRPNTLQHHSRNRKVMNKKKKDLLRIIAQISDFKFFALFSKKIISIVFTIQSNVRF
jgi:hypothetical protein